MRVLVVGAGEVGFDVARILAREQHDVTVVDENPEAAARAADRLDVMTVTGSGTAVSTLAEAGIEEADMLVAVTSIDEVNVIACMMADRLGVETTIARVRTDELTQRQAVLSTQDFGIDVIIHPEESAAAEVTRLIRRASATDMLTFANERLHLVGMRVDEGSSAVGKTLRQLASENADVSFRIMAVLRGMRTLLPRGDEKIRAGDEIFVMGRPEHVSSVAAAMDKSETQMQNVMVLGGTKVGARVAEQLCEGSDRRSVKLVEPYRPRARELAERLPGALVLCGDATDVDLLAAEGLSEMDAFVAVTDDEESNLVTCLMAKHLGVRKTVALLSKPAYIPISQTIGLDAAVSKKLAVSREVSRFLRGKNVRSVATVHGLDAEILEIEAAPRAKVTGRLLKNMTFPEGVLVGAVQQNGHAEVATGETKITAGDRAIVFVLPGKEEAAEGLFK